jgi:hypothetical protein
MPGGGLAKTDKEAVTLLNYRLKQEGSNETKNGLPNNEKPPKKNKNIKRLDRLPL